MFEKYVHTKEDLEAVEEALEHLERPELDFIFKDRNLTKNTLVISFDSKELFIWTKLRTSEIEKMPCRVKNWNAFRTPHKIKIEDDYQKGWRASVSKKEFWNYLPDEFRHSWNKVPKISGSLLTPFTGFHEKQRKSGFRPRDPYSTRESYLATIVHEFGHVYSGKIAPWYYSDKEETASYLKVAMEIYKGDNKTIAKHVQVNLPTGKDRSEVFAVCTEYYASKVFWPSHRKAIDLENISKIREAIGLESKSNLQFEDTVLKEPHFLGAVVGRILMEKYPEDWPVRLLKLS